MIKATNISLAYQQKGAKKPNEVLKNISFTIEKGRISSFIGHSGAGKTSLLKCIANLLTHYEGIITFKGNNIKKLIDALML